MDFLNPGKKVRMIREQLGLKQRDLEGPGMSRNYISMIEKGKRPLTKKAAGILTDTINSLAAERNISCAIEQGYLMETPEESLYKYCINKLVKANTIDEVNEILYYGIKYSLTEVVLKCYIIRGELYSSEKKDIEAISDFNEALQLAYREKMQDRLISIWSKLSSCYIRLMDYNTAVVYLTKAFEACSMLQDSEQKSLVIFNLALCYCEMGKYEKAIETIDGCINLEHNMCTDKLHCVILLTKGGALIECGRYKEAEMLFIRLLEKFEGDNKNIAYCLHNLGTINNKLGKYEDAEMRYDEAIALRKVYDMDKTSTTMIELGEMYIRMGRKNEGVERLEEGIEYANVYGRYKDIIKGCNILEEVYTDYDNMDKIEALYIRLLKILDGNKKMIDYRNKVLNKMGLIYIKRNQMDKSGDC
jgi:tetratricopeptide (TPR) repeat protein